MKQDFKKQQNIPESFNSLKDIPQISEDLKKRKENDSVVLTEKRTFLTLLHDYGVKLYELNQKYDILFILRIIIALIIVLLFLLDEDLRIASYYLLKILLEK